MKSGRRPFTDSTLGKVRGTKPRAGSSLNLHDLLDRMGASLGALIYRKHRFFSESLAATPLREVVGKTTAAVTNLEPGSWHKLTATGPAGQFACAYLVYHWHSIKRPTVLFVHGSGEQPHDFSAFGSNSFRKLLTGDFDLGVNLILLMAPFHDGSQHDYIKALGHLENYVGMLASTTALLEALANRLGRGGCPAVFAVGISLGGWVVNLHRAYYGRHVRRYVPMIAGARLAEVFVSSQYRKLTAEKARENPELLKGVLDFEEDFRASDAGNCLPLLARYDRLVEFGVQRSAYEGMDLTVLNKGHFTGMAATKELREHIRRALI